MQRMQMIREARNPGMKSKPPLIMVQNYKKSNIPIFVWWHTLVGPDTGKHSQKQMESLAKLRESLNSFNNSSAAKTIHHIPQPVVSDIESSATPHKSCQTCSKINNFMLHTRSIRDYSPPGTASTKHFDEDIFNHNHSHQNPAMANHDHEIEI